MSYIFSTPDEVEELRIATLQSHDAFPLLVEAETVAKSMGMHEALDRTYIIADQIDKWLLDHPVILADPELFARAHTAYENLMALYVAIGNIHFAAVALKGETEEECRLPDAEET